MKTVREYQANKEDLVLALVKKYPVYSLDKLMKELPTLSRHAIQNILEKHDLSTVEKRLVFASSFSPREQVLGKMKNFLGRVSFPGESPFLRLRQFKILLLLAVVLLVVWQAASFVFVTPAVTLEKPEVDFINQGEKLFVSGYVVPSRARLQVNQQEVAVNGNGTFTAIVSIPMGESVLEVVASSWGRQAKLVRLISRIPTEEEEKAKQLEEVAKKKETADRLATIDRTVNDLLAAKNASSPQKSLLSVLSSKIKEESGFAFVEGELINTGEQEVGWVMVTVTFYDEAGGVVDKKYGFATDFNQVIKPGETASFETQATTKKFDHYGLELSWQEAQVAGEATSSGQPR